jgi:hypothetical protein
MVRFAGPVARAPFTVSVLVGEKRGDYRTDRWPAFHLESNIRRKTHLTFCEHDPANTDGLRYSRLVSSSSDAIVFEVGVCPASARRPVSATHSLLGRPLFSGWL